MKDQEHDDLWELLGRAKEPVPSAFFSRNVLRAIRQEDRPRPFAWLFPQPRVWRAVSVAALLLLGLFSWQAVEHHQQKEQISALALEVSASPDYTVISHLDELLAYEESSVWLDKNVH